MDICPIDYGGFPEDSPPLTCGCTAEAVKKGDVTGANPYFFASSICRSALHAGVIGAAGGQIVVTPAHAPVYPAVEQNGVVSNSYGNSKGFAVAAVAGVTIAAPLGAATAGTQASSGMSMDICPIDYSGFPEDTPPLTCGCSPEATKKGDVTGANPYFFASSICRAAVHAGAIGPQGGQILVSFANAPVYPAVERNGIKSGSYGASKGFTVAALGGAAIPAPVSIAATGMSMDICPIDYSGFPEDTPPLTCGCSPEATKKGDVTGANPYFFASSICRAAVHAGAIGPQGGQILVSYANAPVYPAVERNGIRSGSYGKSKGFTVAALGGAAIPAQPQVDNSGQPVQAPIAATLKATGHVQLYVNFATDQDQPLPQSEPILRELLATLQGDPSLRIDLIGHTDNQGSGPYNLDLSQRRAAAIYFYLVQHGIDAGRLHSDGRGFMEPIGDNATDSGRALNRRVEAKAID